MNKLILTGFFILFLLPSVFAVDLSFKDLNSRDTIQDALVFLTVNDVTYTEYIDSSGAVFFADYPSQEITFLIDTLETEGFDYTGRFFGGAEQVNAIPVGSLVGIVKDAADNVIERAELQFQCAEFNLPQSYPLETDAFGSFVVEAVPLGQCRIFASYNEAIGFVDLQVEKGQKHDVVIVLNKKVVKKSVWVNPYFLLFLLVVFVVLCGLGYLLFKNHKDASPTPSKVVGKELNEPDESDVAPSNRLKNILPTLNNRETAIVDFLIASNKEANQAAVRHHTSIPRTSLSRAIQSLELKNIIEIRKVGKVVKIKLTKWAQGKD